MPKVSIIMPSLNVRDYIEKCLDSVLGQTLQDIEVICVDADSTDGTHEILERYAKKDTRVRLLRDDQHSTGYAKNLGIDMARGEYIGIVEPDDYIELDMYERLYSAAVADQADIVKCDYSVYVTLDNRHFFVPKKLAFNTDDYNVLMNPQETLKPFGWEMYTWAGIYKTEFLREKKIRHHETKGAAYQDIGFWFQCYAESERVKLIPGTGYLYCQDNPEASVKAADRLMRGLDELEWAKALYDKNKNRWGDIQSAWGNEVIRFVDLAVNNLSDIDRKKLLERAHDMIKDIVLDENYIYDVFRPGGYDKFKQLSSSPESFDEGYKKVIAAKVRERQKVENLIKEHDDLVIISAGSWRTNLQAWLKINFNRSINAYADNDKVKHGTSLNGVIVMPLEEAVTLHKTGVYLIANQVNCESLKNQLLSLGVNDTQIGTILVDRLVDVYL